MALFRETLKYGTFSRENFDSPLWANPTTGQYPISTWIWTKFSFCYLNPLSATGPDWNSCSVQSTWLAAPLVGEESLSALLLSMSSGTLLLSASGQCTCSLLPPFSWQLQWHAVVSHLCVWRSRKFMSQKSLLFEISFFLSHNKTNRYFDAESIRIQSNF